MPMLARDSVFDPILFADGIETHYADDKPLISVKRIERDLDRIEEALAAAQLDILEQQTESLVEAAIPLIEAGDVPGLAQLTWVAGVLLQVPIYDVWQQGYRLGAEHMQAEARAAIPASERSQFAMSPNSRAMVAEFLSQEPLQLQASAVDAAVQARTLQLAGNFSASQLSTLKQDLIAAVIPQAGTGDPISRKELRERIQKNLNVGQARANTIARTELTHAYNVGRIEMAKTSALVEALRFLAITDSRTTDICRSRNGLVIPVSQAATLAANRPPLHYSCRSVLSPVLPRVNPKHEAWMVDPGRQAINRILISLPDGWNQPTLAKQAATGVLEQIEVLPSPQTYQDYINRAKALFADELGAIDQAKAMVDEFKSQADELRAQLAGGDFTLFKEIAKADKRVKEASQEMRNHLKVLRDRLINEAEDSLAKLNADAINYFTDGFAVTPQGRSISFFRDEVEQIYKITNNNIGTLNELIYDEPRAYASRVGVINVGLSNTDADQVIALWHEAGHHLEYSNPTLLSASRDWILSKATDTPQRLSDLTGISYDDSEVAYPDNFIDPYVGKDYGASATEVISMGLQHFADLTQMRNLYEADREHFLLILGALR